MKHLLNQKPTVQPVGYYLRMAESYRYLFAKFCQDLVALNKTEISLFQQLNLKYLIQISFLLNHSLIIVNLFNAKETTKPEQRQRHSFVIAFQKLLYERIVVVIFYHLTMQPSVIDRLVFRQAEAQLLPQLNSNSFTFNSLLLFLLNYRQVLLLIVACYLMKNFMVQNAKFIFTALMPNYFSYSLFQQTNSNEAEYLRLQNFDNDAPRMDYLDQESSLNFIYFAINVLILVPS